jgi:TPR repeat protein
MLVASVAFADAVVDGSQAIKEERWADAYRLLLPEAQKGNTFAQYNVALMLSNGLGVPQDLPQAVKWYERAAKGGDDDAKVNLGLLYAAGGPGLKRDPARAAQLYREAAEAGNGMAQNNLGAAYLKGEGVERNDTEAIKWLNLAAEQDVDVAQNTLGALYCGGDKRPNPIKTDNNLCNKWIQRAVALGNEDAKKTLFFLTKRAAERGQKEAMHNTGGYYLNGFGTTADPVKGVEWLTKAAEAGVKQSQLMLSQLYAKGAYGVPVDSEKAAYWKSKHSQ